MIMMEQCIGEDFFESVNPRWTLKRLAAHQYLHLFIAPHPDDDVIGAGGLMALLARSRRPVAVVYITSGAPGGGRRCPEAAHIRRKEALAALKVVQARGAFFLPFTSRDVLEQPARVQAALMHIVRLTGPHAVYLPCPFEQHPTHRAVTRLSVGVLRRCNPGGIELWGYSVWSALPPCPHVRSVDITRVAHLKRAAVEQHKSQVALKDYPGGILGFNRYAAVFNSLLPDRKEVCYVEQFLDMRMLVLNRRLSLERCAARVFVPHGAAGKKLRR
jgi:LmbE family N-acetylglucosaminyl deacetylase